MKNHEWLPLGFVYNCEIVNPDGSIVTMDPVHNLMPQVSVDFIVSLLRGTGTPIGSWYVFLFENNYVPTSAVTSADLQTTVGESQAYDEATRPAWTHAYDGTAVVDNVASRAVFTFNATKTIYGAGIVSNSTKGGNTGTLLSIARFSSAQSLVSGAEFRVAAGITLIPTSL